MYYLLSPCCKTHHGAHVCGVWTGETRRPKRHTQPIFRNFKKICGIHCRDERRQTERNSNFTNFPCPVSSFFKIAPINIKHNGSFTRQWECVFYEHCFSLLCLLLLSKTQSFPQRACLCNGCCQPAILQWVIWFTRRLLAVISPLP